MDKKLDIRRGMSYVRLVVITLWSLIQDTQFLRKNPIKDQGVVKNKGGKDREWPDMGVGDLQEGGSDSQRRGVLSTGWIGAEAGWRPPNCSPGSGAGRRGGQRSGGCHHRTQGIHRCHFKREIHRICVRRRLPKKVGPYNQYETVNGQFGLWTKSVHPAVSMCICSSGRNIESGFRSRVWGKVTTAKVELKSGFFRLRVE